MTTFRLAALKIAPAGVSALPAPVRRKLLGYLLRWEHYEAARQCLDQLLVTHGHLVTVHDNLARLYLGSGQPERAIATMQDRHALRVSSSSRSLEARAHLAAGNLAAAQHIAADLVAEEPDKLLTWSLLADTRLAAGDLDGAEAAWRQRESLRPDTAATAQGLARVWQARGDASKALLWTRTALARAERDGRQPSLQLLRLLESLYHATGQAAQAEALAGRMERRRQQELEDLRQALEDIRQALDAKPAAEPKAIGPAHSSPPVQPAGPTTQPPGTAVTGAVQIGTDERRRLEDTLHRDFAHEAFRPGQADAVAAVLRGQSVLAVMPTGAGKSLCYQMAALLQPGLTLVISPLIALMKDQLDGLPAGLARQATALHSTLDGAELEARLARAAAGRYKLLYAAPERLRQRPFLHGIKKAGVSLLVVDEAHCVSLWGHDFRPDYQFIAKAWREMDRPPILAMTATATPRVQDDIRAALGEMRLVATDVHRPNLGLEARRFASDAQKQRALLALCQQIEGSGIVYARSRRKCEELAAMLRGHGISAIHYHAGIADRDATQDRFMGDEARIVVATIAFGMGIDKADVRFIIHYHPPKALENYYQEAGRAGRDGQPAHCILFHSPGDQRTLTALTNQSALHVEFLRQVYAAVQRRIGANDVGLVSTADLERDLVADETQLRVAIHFLETAGLLWRGFDLPRTATLTLTGAAPSGQETAGTPGEDAGFARFVEAARLRPGQTVPRDLLALSREAGLDPRTIEAQVLAWQDAGWLRYQGTGRDMLLALPKPPSDAQARVAALLADHRAGQEGRITEMMAYARTKGCRHDHISVYFGGQRIAQCQACDNCQSISPSQQGRHAQAAPDGVQPPPAPVTDARPDRGSAQVTTSSDMSTDAVRFILQGIAQLPFPLGRTGLARALQGAPSSPIKADRFALFGALKNWTQKDIRALIAHLESLGLVSDFRRKDYWLLRLTEQGSDWLTGEPEALEISIDLLAKPSSETPSDYDSDLFQRLRRWRLETARQIEKPAFTVFHDTTLKRIAAARPTTLEELLAIKGIGPRKLEQYGPEVLSIVAGQDDGGYPKKL